MGNPAGLFASGPIAQRLSRIAADYVALAQQHTGALPRTDFDAQWLSPCIGQRHGDNTCEWQPVDMTVALAFERLEHALEVPIHDDVKSYFNIHWSASLPVTFHDNELELLQLWNAQDFEHLLGNLIGHALEKKRVSQPLTLFFGLVDDDRLLTVDNQSGAVMLETLGQRVPLEVASTLEQFLGAVEPRWSTLGD